MPYGGDIGMNVGEDDDVFTCLSQRSFDENKRCAEQDVSVSGLPQSVFAGRSDFMDASSGKTDMCPATTEMGQIHLARMCSIPWVHVEVETRKWPSMRVSYESWERQTGWWVAEKDYNVPLCGEGSERWSLHDSILVGENLTFSSNASHTVVDAVAKAARPAANFNYNRWEADIGGRNAGDLIFSGTRRGNYYGTGMRHGHIKAGNPPADSLSESPAYGTDFLWCPIGKTGLEKLEKGTACGKRTKEAEPPMVEWVLAAVFMRAEGETARAARNYDCIAIYGSLMRRFNGRRSPTEGCLRSNPSTTGVNRNSPDPPRGGAGTLTAYRNALVYWPDAEKRNTDLIKPCLVFIAVCCPRHRSVPGVLGYSGACFSEETENFGFGESDSDYGLNRPEGFDKGRNIILLRSMNGTVCWRAYRMVLDTVSYDSMDISRYIPW